MDPKNGDPGTWLLLPDTLLAVTGRGGGGCHIPIVSLYIPYFWGLVMLSDFQRDPPHI